MVGRLVLVQVIGVRIPVPEPRDERSVTMSHIHTEPGQVDHTVETFVVCGNKVLLRKHEKYGIWLSVGGHIELDEDPNQAALREVKEEVGLEVTLFAFDKIPQFDEEGYAELIPPIFLNRNRINKDHDHVTYTFFARSGTTHVQPESSDDEWRWFTRQDLEKNREGVRPSIVRYALAALDALAK